MPGLAKGAPADGSGGAGPACRRQLAVWFVVVALLAAALVLPTSARATPEKARRIDVAPIPTVGVRAAAPTAPVGLIVTAAEGEPTADFVVNYDGFTAEAQAAFAAAVAVWSRAIVSDVPIVVDAPSLVRTGGGRLRSASPTRSWPSVTRSVTQTTCTRPRAQLTGRARRAARRPRHRSRLQQRQPVLLRHRWPAPSGHVRLHVARAARAEPWPGLRWLPVGDRPERHRWLLRCRSQRLHRAAMGSPHRERQRGNVRRPRCRATARPGRWARPSPR